MNYNQFVSIINANNPPASLSIYLKALWLDANNNWLAAHDLINHLMDTDAAIIHAYLHRKEGDIANATYWYNIARKPVCSLSIMDEWIILVKKFTSAV